MVYKNSEIQKSHDTVGIIGETAFEEHSLWIMSKIAGQSVDYVQKHMDKTICDNITDKHLKRDILVEEAGKILKVEVKADSGKWKDTNNLVLETYKKAYDCPGWFITSNADIIGFYLPKNGTVKGAIFLPMDEQKNLVKRNNYKEVTCLADGDSGYLVPIRNIINQCKSVWKVKVKHYANHNLTYIYKDLYANIK